MSALESVGKNSGENLHIISITVILQAPAVLSTLSNALCCSVCRFETAGVFVTSESNVSEN